MSNQTKVVWIRPESIAMLLGKWREASHICLPLMHAAADGKGRRFEIPADVQIERVLYEPGRDEFGLVLSHGTWQHVPAGAMPPGLILKEVTVYALEIQNPGARGDEPLIIDRGEMPR